MTSSIDHVLTPWLAKLEIKKELQTEDLGRSGALTHGRTPEDHFYNPAPLTSGRQTEREKKEEIID